ncbi:MAG: LacI family DNA-binding transcriptional regulator [Lentisphaeria bacterium]|nr:LacI family DNA-binding transcriptional regulator [Lentisphaeria bacterium]
MMKKQKVTLIEVAELAGVSRAAAGKVLNGGTSKIGVGAEARKRILEAARKLNYQPNMAASILAGGSSKMIGVFVDSFAHYRTIRLLQEIERLASGQGYRIITSFTHDNIANMREDYHALHRYGVNSFICCSHDYPDLKNEVAELFEGAKNVVFMEKPCIPGMPYVGTSRLKALTAMIADALKQGYRKFGTIHRHHSAYSERVLHEEFILAMSANGLQPDENLIFESPKNMIDPQTKVQLALEKMILPYRPDFLYIDDAATTIALRNYLSNTGLNPAICGGNADPLFKYMSLPSFDPGYEMIAAALLDLLLNREQKNEYPVIEAVYKISNFNER